ncbi:hypothetical protein P4H39_25165 [Paenibacillus lautus]|uniref:hypothetical protein n=1 Tax=Paenibacillus lautus TaxID=1401 RepID=UPI002DBBF2C3|nr:hypothetical protein [Paenibacillus lautus]MEC0205905.1 hypothetical protein [Paenibacillus lautus]
MEALHKKFIEQELPLKYTNIEVEEMLVKEYSAKEIPKSTFIDLKNDPQVDFGSIFKCFEIDDKKTLNEKFNEIEKMFHQEYIKGHPSEHFETDWSKIQAGKLLRVILISNDSETLSNFTVQGLCNNLVSDLTIMKGISPEECKLDNDYYVKYLQLLQTKGII